MPTLPQASAIPAGISIHSTSRGPDVAFPPASPSAEIPDWSREARPRWSWIPSRSLLASLRAYEKRRGDKRPDRVFRRRLDVLRHRFWSAVTGADIPLGSRLGGGLLMPHPHGIVIHPDARIGPNCLLMQQVTIGVGGPMPGAPALGGHVDVGAGAKILGGVTIGAHAVIGANAVVLCDVPAGAVAVGVPARLLVRNPEPGLDEDALSPASDALGHAVHR